MISPFSPLQITRCFFICMEFLLEHFLYPYRFLFGIMRYIWSVWSLSFLLKSRNISLWNCLETYARNSEDYFTLQIRAKHRSLTCWKNHHKLQKKIHPQKSDHNRNPSNNTRRVWLSAFSSNEHERLIKTPFMRRIVLKNISDYFSSFFWRIGYSRRHSPIDMVKVSTFFQKQIMISWRSPDQ